MPYLKPWLHKEFARHPQTAEKVWRILQAISLESLLDEGRGCGGLHKLEPKELLNASAEALRAIVPHTDEATGEADEVYLSVAGASQRIGALFIRVPAIGVWAH